MLWCDTINAQKPLNNTMKLRNGQGFRKNLEFFSFWCKNDLHEMFYELAGITKNIINYLFA